MPAYEELLVKQPLSTRVSIGQAVVASLLRGNTRIQQVDDVKGVLQLCQDLVKDTTVEDRQGASAQVSKLSLAHQHPAISEEQGWLARIVHLFVAEDLGTHLAVRTEATSSAA